MAEYGSMGCVYLLSCADYYKIGRTINLPVRLAQLTTGSPLPIHVIHHFECSNSQEVERYLHQLFASKRAQGEWFKLSGRDVEAFCGLPGRSIEQSLRELDLAEITHADAIEGWFEENQPLWGAL